MINYFHDIHFYFVSLWHSISLLHNPTIKFVPNTPLQKSSNFAFESIINTSYSKQFDIIWIQILHKRWRNSNSSHFPSWTRRSPWWPSTKNPAVTLPSPRIRSHSPSHKVFQGHHRTHRRRLRRRTISHRQVLPPQQSSSQPGTRIRSGTHRQSLHQGTVVLGERHQGNLQWRLTHQYRGHRHRGNRCPRLGSNPWYKNFHTGHTSLQLLRLQFRWIDRWDSHSKLVTCCQFDQTYTIEGFRPKLGWRRSWLNFNRISNFLLGS